MLTGESNDWTIEFQTGNGDWQLAMAGRKWKTHAGALNAMRKWAYMQATEFSWSPPVRCIELAKSYNARGRVSLVAA